MRSLLPLAISLCALTLYAEETHPTDLRTERSLIQQEIADLEEGHQEAVKTLAGNLIHARSRLTHLKQSLEQHYDPKIEEELLLAKATFQAAQIELLDEKQNFLKQSLALEEELQAVNSELARYEVVMETTSTPSYRASVEEPEPKMYSYRPKINQASVIFGGEFLYWRMQEGSLDFAVRGQQAAATGQATYDIGDFEIPDFKWKAGYRAYFGFRTSPKLWDLDAIYTYYYGKGNKTVHTPHPSQLLANPTPSGTSVSSLLIGTFPQATGTAVFTAKADMNLHYNVGDLLLGRRFGIAKDILLKLQMGATGAWIEEKFHYKYIGTPAVTAATVRGKQNFDFRGGGMRIGINLDWFIGSGFSLIGNATTACLVGHYHQHATNRTSNAGATPPQTLQDSRYRDTRLATHTQLSLLPAWGITGRHVAFLIYGGYEFNYWTNLVEIYRSDSSVNSYTGRATLRSSGNLGIQGITAGASLKF
ncbi:MAG: hypothetical protein JSS61_00725 [Verrucomicrobia bacterium]|nr:hypothetical protein [Verrucomicrobiota bacterium]